jgi:hypothetical protein
MQWFHQMPFRCRCCSRRFYSASPRRREEAVEEAAMHD